jgi:hypothetical protein
MPDDTDRPIIVLPGPQQKQSPLEQLPERRIVSRIPFTAVAEVTEARSQARSIGRSSDLSTKGCYVDTLSTFGVGAAVHVRLERDMHEFEADAVVTNTQMSMGMGLVFTNIPFEHEAVLRTWLAEPGGERPNEPVTAATSRDVGLHEAIVDVRQVLNELIDVLVRKKMISENEGAGLLRRMNRTQKEVDF